MPIGKLGGVSNTQPQNSTNSSAQTTNAAGQLVGASVNAAPAPKRQRASESPVPTWPAQMAAALPVVVQPRVVQPAPMEVTPAPQGACAATTSTEGLPGYYEVVTPAEEAIRGFFVTPSAEEQDIATAVETLHTALYCAFGNDPEPIPVDNLSNCKEILRVAIKSNAGNPQALRNLESSLKRIHQLIKSAGVYDAFKGVRLENLEKINGLISVFARSSFEAKEALRAQRARITALDAKILAAESFFLSISQFAVPASRVDPSISAIARFKKQVAEIMEEDEECAIRLLEILQGAHDGLYREESAQSLTLRLNTHAGIEANARCTKLFKFREELLDFARDKFSHAQMEHETFRKTGYTPKYNREMCAKNSHGADFYQQIIECLNAGDGRGRYTNAWCQHAIVELKALCADPFAGAHFWIRLNNFLSEPRHRHAVETNRHLQAIYQCLHSITPPLRGE